MKKIFLIGWKDLTLAFRDRAALILMLAAPFLLTLGLGFVTGGFSGASSGGIGNIPIVVVNQDGGQLGSVLVEMFQSKELKALVTATLLDDPAEARRLVDQDKTASAVIIPAGFSQSIIPAAGSQMQNESPLNCTACGIVTSAPYTAPQIELVTNPSRPTSSGVIKTILEEYLSRVEVGRVGGQVVVTQLVQAGLVKPQDAAAVGAQIGTRQGTAAQGGSNITIKNVDSGSEAVPFNVLAYMAPGMALMFLMYTVSNGGRSLLAERNLGTLPRLLVAPVSTAQVLGGKIFGIYLTGVAQMLILIGASTLLFRLNWGDALAVVALVLAAVVGAVGWGMLITALAKTPGQVAGVGSAVMLTFGVLGGSFVDLGNFPVWFQWASKITPNAWGLEGFSTLASGGGMSEIFGPLAGLLVMGAVLFGAAVWIFNRRGIIQR